MRVSFHGAAGMVTGSCHLIECGGRKILVDCGLFQGARESEEENAAAFGFEPAEIDCLLLTHAHLDHCGRIPLLRKRGFEGEIVTTKPTRELARLVLLDAAHLQEEEYRRRIRHHDRHRHGKRSQVPGPLYGIVDAAEAFDCFGRTAEYGKPMEIVQGVSATFNDAGHILGSAWIRLQLTEDGNSRSIVFSGDLGSSGRPLLRDPDIPAKADVLVTESTYGDRQHKSLDSSLDELYAAISETYQRGGNCVIPTFALDRAQELLFFLREGERQRRIPPNLSIFLDSPMAITATEIYRRSPGFYRKEIRDIFHHESDPFHPSGLVLTRDVSESIALNSVERAVIMAGSGMCTGGRIRHHLVHNIANSKSSIIFVGYAAEGTLARHIVDGARTVRIFGETYPVRANTYTINGFSAHADRQELLDWARDVHAGDTFLVHGEKKSMTSFAAALPHTKVHMPAMHQSFRI